MVGLLPDLLELGCVDVEGASIIFLDSKRTDGGDNAVQLKGQKSWLSRVRNRKTVVQPGREE